MSIEMIITFVTAIVTLIFGEFAKRFNWLETRYIPYQNLFIGVFSGILCFCTGLYQDVITAIVMCTVTSLGAGGMYDLKKGLSKGEK